MLKKSLSWSVKQVSTMITKGTITFDNPIQRPAGQWKDEDKSLLIHSLLTMFMPDIIALQVPKDIEGKKVNTYDIIDGLQRLTNINSFLNDEWVLTELKPIKLESTGEKYNISGKKFSELPEEVQEEIKGYTVTFKAIELEEEDEEEEIIEEIFYRLNNGKSMSREHMALVSAGKNVQQFTRKTIIENPLFKIAHYSDSSAKKSDKEMTVLQTILLISGLDYNTFSAKDIEKVFAENNIENEILDKVEGYFVDIAEAFSHTEHKFITKINISTIAYLLHNNENIEQVQAFIKWYANNYKSGDVYKRYCGAGCTKKDSVKNRLKGLQELFNAYVINNKPQVKKEPQPENKPKTTLHVVKNSHNDILDDDWQESCSRIPHEAVGAMSGMY